SQPASRSDTSMPLGPRFPASGVIIPGRFGGQREYRDVGCVADLLFGIAAEETDESDSVEVHTFLGSARLSRAPESKRARLPRAAHHAAAISSANTGGSRPMPTDDGFGLEDSQRLPPAKPGLSEDRPESRSRGAIAVVAVSPSGRPLGGEAR